eukprot:CAMPEP_0184672776 /NCGR_PEP_ID=MMETSP0308-20130426/86299_1 /TAXON_ID=38269 /ORGANISM="Gloeochaete witrockiana, Strain SAG 46.84" /LENGTH=464 /DNA_ID=CAMNT_0027120163 /DNA_START=706 /DNA_END=2097 /DNA_ORIENTATION=+
MYKHESAKRLDPSQQSDVPRQEAYQISNLRGSDSARRIPVTKGDVRASSRPSPSSKHFFTQHEVASEPPLPKYSQPLSDSSSRPYPSQESYHPSAFTRHQTAASLEMGRGHVQPLGSVVADSSPMTLPTSSPTSSTDSYTSILQRLKTLFPHTFPRSSTHDEYPYSSRYIPGQHPSHAVLDLDPPRLSPPPTVALDSVLERATLSGRLMNGKYSGYTGSGQQSYQERASLGQDPKNVALSAAHLPLASTTTTPNFSSSNNSTTLARSSTRSTSGDRLTPRSSLASRDDDDLSITAVVPGRKVSSSVMEAMAEEKEKLRQEQIAALERQLDKGFSRLAISVDTPSLPAPAPKPRRSIAPIVLDEIDLDKEMNLRIKQVEDLKIQKEKEEAEAAAQEEEKRKAATERPLRTLNSDQVAKVRRAWSGPEKEIVSCKSFPSQGNLELARKDFSCLQGNRWLTDEVDLW